MKLIASRLLGMCLVLGLLLSGCSTAYYSTMEKFGVYKRDLLKKKVVQARDDQKAAGEEFKDALTKLKELYSFQGGDLEKQYHLLKGQYDDANSRATTVHNRIKDVEKTAEDLFAEWEKELTQITTPALRDNSREQLRQTRNRYDDLHTALKRAERSMDPVLTKLRDQVLYLKHNLNAAAIASLKGESLNIQNDITKLIEEMNRSILQADEFIKAMP